MMEALKELQTLECSFLVSGRRTENGIFYSSCDFIPPPQFKNLFMELEEFRFDISSTDLRNKGQFVTRVCI